MNSRSSYNDLPVVGLDDVTILEQFIAHPEPPKADPNWLLDQLGMLALKPMRRVADVEASAIIQRDFRLLANYPNVDLGYAIGRLTRESKFYPEISELIKMVEYPAAKREYRRQQAKTALLKHKHQWQPPIADHELCKPEDVAAILAEVDAEFAAKENRT